MKTITKYYFRDTFLIGLIGAIVLIFVLAAVSHGADIAALKSQKAMADSEVSSMRGQAAFIKKQIDMLILSYADAVAKQRTNETRSAQFGNQIKKMEAEAKDAANKKDQTKGEPAVEPEPVQKE